MLSDNTQRHKNESGTARPNPPPWHVLVVDDDESVLQLTKFILGRLSVLDRPLKLVYAHTSQEARALCQSMVFAVAIVDVVMETDNAGLEFVAWLRSCPEAQATRLVIRTGQPGLAPEDFVLHNYEINDYWPKTEISAQRIRTVITGLIRSYHELSTLERQRNDLSKVVTIMPELLNQQNAARLLASLAKALDHLFGSSGSSLFFALQIGNSLGDARVLASNQEPTSPPPLRLIERLPPLALSLLHESSQTGRVIIQDPIAALLVRQPNGRCLAMVGELWTYTDDWSCEIAELLLRNSLEFLDNLLTQSQHLTDLERQLRQDSLTGLSNRQGLLENLERSLTQGDCLALVLIQLDQLDPIRAAYGPEIADKVLQAIADRLSRSSQAPVARLDSDRFALLLSTGTASVVSAVSTIDQLFDQPFQVSSTTFRLHAHQGIALAAAQSPADILRQADLALKLAIRQDGARFAFYDPSLAASDIRIAQLETDIERSNLDAEFFTLFQPILTLADGRIRGAEALLRWNSPRFGPVGPNEFIPLAERTGHINTLTKLVLQNALRALDTWQRVNPTMYVSVNVSPSSLSKPGFVAMLLEALGSRDPSGLYLELTESEQLSHDQVCRQQMQTLRARGIRFMIDDFGTGYSSLSYLHKLPFDAIKIDHGFISQISEGINNPHRRLLEAILGVADSLQMPVTAEGIETPHQAATLTRLKCKNGQGFLYSRPIPADAILELLQQQPPIVVS